MNYRITEDAFEKIYVLTRMVTDLSTRLANEGDETNTVWMTLSGHTNSIELGVLKSDKGVACEVMGTYTWYYDNAITSSTFEGAKEFLRKWENELFTKKDAHEEDPTGVYIQHGVATWSEKVFECSHCGQEFMIDRHYPNWCPLCGRALDCE